MDSVEKNQLPDDEVKRGYLIPREEKFRLVNCTLKGAFCNDQILPEINRLYAEAEVYRINKEYQRAIDLLQEANRKTCELTQPACARCVSFFQYSIKDTLQIMEEELHAMSNGFFSNARYQVVYSRLGKVLNKMNRFNKHQPEVISTKVIG